MSDFSSSKRMHIPPITIATYQKFVTLFSAGMVPKSSGQIPKAGEATTKGAGSVGDSCVQRHDAQYLPDGHPSVPTVSTPQLHQQHEQQIFPGKNRPLVHKYTCYICIRMN
jgi:hypothetical protein